MKTVTLKAMLSVQGGAIMYPGERVRLPDDIAASLIEQGRAVGPKEMNCTPVVAPRSAPEERITKPVMDAGALKGVAKREWLKREITARGGVPEGRTIAALAAQLEAMGG